MSVSPATPEAKNGQEIPNNNPLDVLARHFTQEMHLSQSHEENVKKMLNRAFCEPIAGTELYKPNSLAFLLRAMQLEIPPFLPENQDELRTLLANSWVAEADVSNLKLLNDESGKIGGSFAAGDEAVRLHAQSIAGAELGPNTRTILVRPQGDEFFVMILSKDPQLSEKEIKSIIQSNTVALIAKAAVEDGNPLKTIAANMPVLIDKTLDFAPIANIKIPADVKRMDDMIEWMLSQVEEANMHKKTAISRTKRFINSVSLPSVASRKKKLNGPAIDHLMAAIDQSTNITPRELDLQVQANRKVVIDIYCPDSLRPTLESLRIATGEEPQANVQLLTLAEQALFNEQFSREHPVLNKWCFDELNRATHNGNYYQYGVLGMVSSFFVKMVNIKENRIAGTRILRVLADKMGLTAPSQTILNKRPDILLTKVGGSFLYSSTDGDVSMDFKTGLESSNIEENADANIIDKLNSRFDRNPGVMRLLYRLATQTVVVNQIDLDRNIRNIRSEELWLAKTDEVKNIHYLEETRKAHRMMKIFIQLKGIKELWRAFIAERADRRHEDLLMEDPSISQDPEEFFKSLDLRSDASLAD